MCLYWRYKQGNAKTAKPRYVKRYVTHSASRLPRSANACSVSTRSLSSMYLIDKGGKVFMAISELRRLIVRTFREE